MTPSSSMVKDKSNNFITLDNKSKKECKSFSNKWKSLKAITIKKNYRKDWPNLKEVSDLLKLEEEVKWKSDKLKIESLTPFVPLRLLSVRVLFQEEDAHFFTLLKLWMNYWKIQTGLKDKLLVLKLFNTQSKCH